MISLLRHSGGPALHPNREPRGTQHHPERTHQVHHLSALQTRTQPQGETNAPAKRQKSPSDPPPLHTHTNTDAHTHTRTRTQTHTHTHTHTLFCLIIPLLYPSFLSGSSCCSSVEAIGVGEWRDTGASL